MFFMMKDYYYYYYYFCSYNKIPFVVIQFEQEYHENFTNFVYNGLLGEIATNILI